MLPKQAKEIPQHRTAKAPYNFVELPEQVVLAESLEPNNQYYQHRHTGRIECQLTTESPLYTRCGFTPKDYVEIGETPYDKQTSEQRTKRAQFFSNPANLLPMIPGSSLRGMLRSLVEIVSFGKFDRVSEESKFFFRAVAAERDDPLKTEYNKYIPKTVKAGYLEQRDGRWFIRPASTIDGASFAWVKEAAIRSTVPALIPLRSDRYLPQYIPVSFEETQFKNCRRFTQRVSQSVDRYRHKGILVTSGNMRQEGDTSEPNRKCHCVVAAPNQKVATLEIDADAIRAYRDALTDFQQQPPFDQKMGTLIIGRPVFYCEPESGNVVTRFGHNPNFRLPYTLPDQSQSSVVDFVPESLKDMKMDLADAIFGFVRGEKREGSPQSRSGRVSVGDAVCQNSWEVAQYQTAPIIPKTLSSPKPTTFEHYLVQKDSQAKQAHLKHYASKPIEETVIRGHKLYWHQGEAPAIQLKNPDEVSETQKTSIHPIAPQQTFKFTIHFENLSDVELGAILWILDVAADKNYRLSLGMGKPLGMGAVKLNHEVYFSDRQHRYRKLFDQNDWQICEKSDAKKCKECNRSFERYVLDRIGETDHPTTGKAQSLKDVPRIKMLLTLLSWSKLPDASQIRYMTIEPNEYKDRRVLPTPFQVMEECDLDDRQFATAIVSTRPDQPKPKPSKKKEVVEPPQVQQFMIGQILDATVEGKNGVKVTYLVAGEKRSNPEHKRHQNLQVGAVVKVEVISLKENGMFNKIKLWQG